MVKISNRPNRQKCNRAAVAFREKILFRHSTPVLSETGQMVDNVLSRPESIAVTVKNSGKENLPYSQLNHHEL